MPLLDIAIAQSSIPTHLGYTRVRLFINGNIPNYPLLQHEDRWASSRKSLQNTGNLNFGLVYFKKSCPGFLVSAVATLEPQCLNFGLVYFKKSCPGFLVSAVATLEPQCLVLNKDIEKDNNALSSTAELQSITVQNESSSGGSEEVDEREKLRRLRISKANKGNTPWNKGRKHSPETLRRIKEKTRLAMQSPKVKMKLATMGHAQSPETRVKIAAGVRMGWQKRREMLMLQETCIFDWQNLIAEAARGGFQDEEELQWDSYDILSKQLQQEWLESIEHRKSLPRPKGSKRAPKSLEQRRKIAEAISAKWADPAYRTRVCTGLAKYHRIPEGAERKVRKKQSGEDSTNTSRKKSEKEKSTANGSTQLPKLKKRNVPKYKDPLSTSKLEMLKSIRAQRGTSDTMKIEALERAKLLIAEAQKAAKALEVAATRSPVARASLIEAHKLIAEATQSIKSIENGELPPQDNVQSGHQEYAGKGGETLTEDADQRYNIAVNGKKTITPKVNQEYQKMVNGFQSMKPGEDRNLDTNLYHKHTLPTSLGGYMLGLSLESFAEKQDIKERTEKQYPLGKNGVPSVNGVKLQNHEEHAHPTAKSATKKWVRGRLVEVGEGVINNDGVSD
ncbi:uncharacterized protein LOC141633320 isoform X2 [Silene latifolia]|uniref:uncharacterized protein LOC141633320 isoform X2 n=1 Tax=Silene latifolia TaxID=37657 RepID=UPI003D7840CE